MTVKVKVRRADKNVKLPEYKTAGAAGMDVYANEECDIRPGETKLVDTGLFFEIPPGYEIQVRPRSGMALDGVTVGNAPGTIDSDYRGPIKIIIYNHSTNYDFVRVCKGHRIAQIVLKEQPRIEWEEVDELGDTVRGGGGFGSTGGF